MSVNSHPFLFSGFAQVSDLKSNEWSEVCARLTKDQESFLSNEASFRSEGYRWPRDPLHTWSRIWEYPYAFYHLDVIKNSQSSDRLLTAADIGSGVTFFPFSVARLGYRVTCVDIDPICATDIPLAARVTDCRPGSVDVSIMKGSLIDLPNNYLDVAYCISVLEHVDNYSALINEIARVLRPGGHFILTLDVDLRGNSEIGIDKLYDLKRLLDMHFDPACSNRWSHPKDYLTNLNSHHKMYNDTFGLQLRQLARNIKNRTLFRDDLRASTLLTVLADVMTKRSPPSNNSPSQTSS